VNKSLKAVSLLLVLVMFVGLIGCGEAGGSKETTTSKAQSTTAATTAQATTVDPKNQTTFEGEVTGSLPITDKPITSTYRHLSKPRTQKSWTVIQKSRCFRNMKS
jgi:uncharacterized lipoprotein YehR (DUF1307 family)